MGLSFCSVFFRKNILPLASYCIFLLEIKFFMGTMVIWDIWEQYLRKKNGCPTEVTLSFDLGNP